MMLFLDDPPYHLHFQSHRMRCTEEQFCPCHQWTEQVLAWQEHRRQLQILWFRCFWKIRSWPMMGLIELRTDYLSSAADWLKLVVWKRRLHRREAAGISSPVAGSLGTTECPRQGLACLLVLWKYFLVLVNFVNSRLRSWSCRQFLGNQIFGR